MQKPALTRPRTVHVRSTRSTAAMAMAALAVLLIGTAISMPQAQASDLDANSALGALRSECTANDLAFVFGQVWDDEPEDAMLTEDAGVAGVTVELTLEGLTPTTTDADGFWGYCITNPELHFQPATLVVSAPPGRQFTSEGSGTEDRDSDVDANGSTTTFTINDEFRNPQFETTRSEIRIDAGLAMVPPAPTTTTTTSPPPTAAPSTTTTPASTTTTTTTKPATVTPTPTNEPGNPCPIYNDELVAQDANGDWDRDGTPNSRDEFPCAPETARGNPCPVFTDELVEADPDGDWDRDGTPNNDDELPCTGSDGETVASAAPAAPVDDGDDSAATTVPSNTEPTNTVPTNTVPEEAPTEDNESGPPLGLLGLGAALPILGVGALLGTRKTRDRRDDEQRAKATITAAVLDQHPPATLYTEDTVRDILESQPVNEPSPTGDQPAERDKDEKKRPKATIVGGEDSRAAPPNTTDTAESTAGPGEIVDIDGSGERGNGGSAQERGQDDEDEDDDGMTRGRIIGGDD